MNLFSKHLPKAFTVLDMMMIVVALAAMAVVVLPVVAKRHTRSAKVSCTNQLKPMAFDPRMCKSKCDDLGVKARA